MGGAAGLSWRPRERASRIITLYDNPFSPFARKVRMALGYKGAPSRSVDALALAELEHLRAVNPRAEVPVIDDEGVVVVGSADIAAHLEDRFPTPPLFPHVSSLKLVGVALEPFASVRRWDGAMRELAFVREDLRHVKRSAIEKFGTGASPYEAEKVVWRGDRIEWLLARGFAGWFWAELAAGRVVVPEPA